MRTRSSGFALVVAAVAALSLAPRVDAQLVLQTSDGTSNIRFGALVQAWADWTQSSATGDYSQNLYLRRFRLLVGGQIMPGLTFFAQTDDPNLGKAVAGTKTIGSGFIMQDAYLEYRRTDAIFLDAGLIDVPLCRNCLTAAQQQMSLDFGTYSFAESAATNSVNGRDTGFELRGFLAADKLEYRFGAEQGVRNAAGNNSFRFNGRVQYDFLEPQKIAYLYNGVYFGQKRVLAVGASFDTQGDYRAWSGDAFLDIPAGSGSVTAEGDFLHYDGRTFLATLPDQNDLTAQAGYYFPSAQVMPFVRFENQNFQTAGLASNDSRRYQIGLGYYLKGQNANIKVAYTRIRPRTGSSSNELTLQLQGFYF